MAHTIEKQDWVGPVLQRGPVSNAVIAAIREQNPQAEIVDRGGYIRVLAPGRCSVTRAAIEQQTGESFRLPSDLECIMPAFKGKFSVSEDAAHWDLLPKGPT